MTRIFSNGPTGDFVVNPYDRLIEKASQIYLAAPYTECNQIVRGAAAGKKFQLLVGLNSVTTPRALESVHGINNVSVRYLTHRFHAKIFIFDVPRSWVIVYLPPRCGRDLSVVGYSFLTFANVSDGRLRTDEATRLVCLVPGM
jgi:hypothetical protein